jgi:hypothetical protein
MHGDYQKEEAKGIVIAGWGGSRMMEAWSD